MWASILSFASSLCNVLASALGLKSKTYDDDEYKAQEKVCAALKAEILAEMDKPDTNCDYVNRLLADLRRQQKRLVNLSARISDSK